jgi:hypothetical protein
LAERKALEMITVKLARTLSGDPLYADHWRDHARYGWLAAGEGGA